MTQDNQHNEMPKDTVENLALFIVEKWPPECDVSDHDEMVEDVVQALTTAYNKGVEVGSEEAFKKANDALLKSYSWLLNN